MCMYNLIPTLASPHAFASLKKTQRNGAELKSAGVNTDKVSIFSCWDLLDDDVEWLFC